MTRRAVLIAAAIAVVLLAGFFLAIRGQRGSQKDVSGSQGGFQTVQGPRESPSGDRTPGSAAGLEVGRKPARPTIAGESPAGEGAGEGDGAPRPLPGSGDSTLSVLVTDTEGRPISGASVQVAGDDGRGVLATGKDGRAELAGIPAGTYKVQVLPPGPQAHSLRTAMPLSISPGESREITCIVPSLDVEIAGRVLDPQGEPVEGIEVWASAVPITGSSGPRFISESKSFSVSGPDGEFRILRLSRGEHTLQTKETPRYHPVWATALAGSAEPVEITLGERRALVLRGKVSDHAGEPVSGAAVMVGKDAHSRTDPDGGFQIETAYEGRALILSVRKDGYSPATKVISATDISGGDEVEADIRLEPLGEGGFVEGLVVDALSGVPLPGIMVHLHSPSLKAAYRMSSGENGGFALGTVPVASDYRLWVNPQRDYRDFTLTPLEVVPGENQVEIALEPVSMGFLKGIMRDPGGKPIPHLTLWVQSGAATAWAVPVTGDAGGRFPAEEAPEGEIFLVTRAPPLVSVRGFRVEPGRTLEAEVVVGLGAGRLSGQVVRMGGVPVPGTRLALSWYEERGAIRTSVHREAASDAVGRFSFSGIARGRGTLTASAPGFMERQEARELSGGNEETRLELEPAKGQ